jgi:hypothetical protein
VKEVAGETEETSVWNIRSASVVTLGRLPFLII